MSEILRNKRVLVVEDEALIAMLAEEMLVELGCIHHATAPTIPKALPLVEAGGFDLALLDVNVARERVFPVADALIARSIPFAFASGYGEEGLPEAYASRPMIGKPYSAEDLERALVQALGG
jgi:CheY-like chemotaxis protein